MAIPPAVVSTVLLLVLVNTALKIILIYRWKRIAMPHERLLTPRTLFSAAARVRIAAVSCWYCFRQFIDFNDRGSSLKSGHPGISERFDGGYIK
jgi:hypothetical protein